MRAATWPSPPAPCNRASALTGAPSQHSRGARETVAEQVLQLGPLRCRLAPHLPDPQLAALTSRLDCARTVPACADFALTVEGRHRDELRDDPLLVVGPDLDRADRHDFSIQRHAHGWRAETLATAAAVEAALRWVTAIELGGRGGLLLHASSLVFGGRAHLFLGGSGAGKSTLAAEGGADAVLSDELSLIAPASDGRWLAWTSPFWGDGGRGRPHRPAPVAALWVLHGHETTQAHPLEPAMAVLAVCERAIDVGPSPTHARRVLDAAARLAGEHPVRRLSWRRGDISGLRRLLGAADNPPPETRPC